MKWSMQSYTKFTGVSGDYNVKISSSSLGWIWHLFKGNDLIDDCFQHSPIDSELACKAQVEKIVNNLNQQSKL